MSGPQPHSHQWPLDENETPEKRAHMHKYHGPTLRHQMPLYQSMAGDEGWHTNTYDTALKHDKQWSRIMQTWHTMQSKGPGTVTSDVRYTIGIHSNAPKSKPTPNRP